MTYGCAAAVQVRVRVGLWGCGCDVRVRAHVRRVQGPKVAQKTVTIMAVVLNCILVLVLECPEIWSTKSAGLDFRAHVGS